MNPDWDKAWLVLRPQLECGLILEQPSLKKWAVLMHALNPIVYGHEPDFKQLVQFLWVCSTDFTEDIKRQEEWISTWQPKFNYDTWKEIKPWVEQILADKSRPMKSSNTTDVDDSVASWIAYIIDLFSQRGWTVEYILNIPIRQIWQLIKIHRVKNGGQEVVDEYVKLLKQDKV